MTNNTHRNLNLLNWFICVPLNCVDIELMESLLPQSFLALAPSPSGHWIPTEIIHQLEKSLQDVYDEGAGLSGAARDNTHLALSFGQAAADALRGTVSSNAKRFRFPTQ